MEMRQLLTLRTIVEQGSFLKAAEELGYAQSTVTLHIQQLEASLKVVLFSRTGRRMTLTETGREFYEEIVELTPVAEGFGTGTLVSFYEEIVELTRHWEEVHAHVAETTHGRVGHIHIGAIEPAARLKLMPVVAAFCQARPQVRLTLESGGTRTLCERVTSGLLSAAVCSSPLRLEGLIFEPLWRQSLALLLPERHRLAEKEEINLEDLRQEWLILSEPDCAYRQAAAASLLPHGIGVRSRFEIGSIETVKSAVKQGMGIAIVPADKDEDALPGTTLRPIAGVNLTLPIGLVRRRTKAKDGRLLSAFLEEIRSCLTSSKDGKHHGI